VSGIGSSASVAGENYTSLSAMSGDGTYVAFVVRDTTRPTGGADVWFNNNGNGLAFQQSLIGTGLIAPTTGLGDAIALNYAGDVLAIRYITCTGQRVGGKSH